MSSSQNFVLSFITFICVIVQSVLVSTSQFVEGIVTYRLKTRHLGDLLGHDLRTDINPVIRMTEFISLWAVSSFKNQLNKPRQCTDVNQTAAPCHTGARPISVMRKHVQSRAAGALINQTL
jgi:hypothetical protein